MKLFRTKHRQKVPLTRSAVATIAVAATFMLGAGFLAMPANADPSSPTIVTDPSLVPSSGVTSVTDPSTCVVTKTWSATSPGTPAIAAVTQQQYSETAYTVEHKEINVGVLSASDQTSVITWLTGIGGANESNGWWQIPDATVAAAGVDPFKVAQIGTVGLQAYGGPAVSVQYRITGITVTVAPPAGGFAKSYTVYYVVGGPVSGTQAGASWTATDPGAPWTQIAVRTVSAAVAAVPGVTTDYEYVDSSNSPCAAVVTPPPVVIPPAPQVVSPIACAPTGGFTTEDVAPTAVPTGLQFDGPSAAAIDTYQRVTAGNLQGVTGISYNIASGETGQPAQVVLEVNPNTSLNNNGTVNTFATISTNFAAGSSGTLDASGTLWSSTKILSGPGSLSDPISYADITALMPNNTLLSAPSLHLLSNSQTGDDSIVTSLTSSCGSTSFAQVQPAPMVTVTPVTTNDCGTMVDTTVTTTTTTPYVFSGGSWILGTPVVTTATTTAPATTTECPPAAPQVCVATPGWTTEDVAPAVTADGLVFQGPSASAVDTYQRATGNLQGVTGITYTIADGETGQPAQIVLEVNPNAVLNAGGPVVNYATISTNFATGSSGVLTPTGAIWSTTKITSGPGSLSDPISYAQIVALMPNNTLLSAPSLHLLSGSGSGDSSTVTSISSSCGSTIFVPKPAPVVTVTKHTTTDCTTKLDTTVRTKTITGHVFTNGAWVLKTTPIIKRHTTTAKVTLEECPPVVVPPVVVPPAAHKAPSAPAVNASAPVNGLAHTGSDVEGPVVAALAALLVVLGAIGLVLIGRRRDNLRRKQ